MTDPRVAISEITTAEWSFEEDVEAYGSADGVDGIGIWRDKLAASDLSVDQAADRLDAVGLEAASLIFAGGFTDREAFEEQVADAETAIDDAATLGAPVLLVIGGPRLGVSAEEGNTLVREALEALAPAARTAGVTLALEPLHPVDITRFSTVVTLDQALDLVEGLDGVGVFVDSWNVWWDPSALPAIEAAGDDVAAVHLADWRHHADDPRDRAPPGAGVAPLEEFVEALRVAGYDGWYEVELFTESYATAEYPDLIDDCIAGARGLLEE